MRIKKLHMDAIHLMTYTNLTLQEIADKLNVSIQTIYRWRSTPSFKEALNEELEGKVEYVRDSFKKDAEEIYGELHRLMFDEETAPRDKINIGKYVLDHAVGKSHENIQLHGEINTEVKREDILKIFEEEEK